MDNRASQILKAINKIEQEQDIRSGVPIKLVAKYLKQRVQNLESIVEWLGQEQYLSVHIVRSNLKLIKLTEKGYQAAKPWYSEERWKFVFAIISTLAILPLIFPRFVDTYRVVVDLFRSSSGLLVIESARLDPSIESGNYRILANDLVFLSDSAQVTSDETFYIPCIDYRVECNVGLYLPGLIVPKNFEMVVSNLASDTSAKIEGVKVTLVAYADLPQDGFDVVKYLPDGVGGGGGGSVYDLSELPLETISESSGFELDMKTKKSPHRSVGNSAIGELVCSPDVTECSEYQLIDPRGTDGIKLQLSFVEKLPPGIYKFDIAIYFSYQGEKLVSDSGREIIIIKPTLVNPWTQHYEDGPIVPSTFWIDALSSSVIPSKGIEQPNWEGSLVFRSYVGLDNAYYIWDLKDGNIEHVGNFGMLTRENIEFMRNVVSSNTGWEKAFEILSSSLRQYDIGIVDINNSTITQITRTPFIREMSPDWSPTNSQLAYVAYAFQDTDELHAGQADIYIYEISIGKTTRITNTPEVIESSPTWIDENRIAFLMPQIDDDNVNPYTDLPENARVGIGIVDALSGEIYIVSDSFIEMNSSLEFMDNLGLVVQTSGNTRIFNIQGELEIQFERKQFPPCYLLNSYPVKELCVYQGYTGIYHIPGNDFEQLENILPDRNYIMGSVIPSGFILADVERGVVHQYSDDGVWMRDWNAPQISQIFDFGVFELILIPNQVQ